jgi:hypothetical protein
MKNTSPLRTAFLVSVLACAGAGVVLAQDASSFTPPANNSGSGGSGSGWHHHGMPGLTPEEQAEIQKDTEQVLAANPDLKKQHDDLMASRPGQDASQDDKTAFHAKMKDFNNTLRPEIEKIDPNAAALFAKVDAAIAARKAGGQ